LESDSCVMVGKNRYGQRVINRDYAQIASSAIFLSDYNTMTSADAIDVYSTLSELGIQIWIDGGWGVDALLGKQTRPHKDLDIALEDQHLVRFERFLALRGYHRTKREIERPFNFVLADHGGREIDVHVISLDENGDGIYGPPENCLAYPAESLTALARSVVVRFAASPLNGS
jgi:Aminoglycoside-2''-adenylyltransferase